MNILPASTTKKGHQVGGSEPRTGAQLRRFFVRAHWSAELTHPVTLREAGGIRTQPKPKTSVGEDGHRDELPITPRKAAAVELGLSATAAALN